MQVEYHKGLDIVTIWLRDALAGEEEYTHWVEGPFMGSDEAAYGRITLDFDADKRLIAIEVQRASMSLPPQLLASATRIDQ